MDTGWAVDVLTARGLHIEQVETIPDKRLLFRINDDLLCIGDEHPKGTLAEPRQQNLWLSVFCDLSFDGLVQGWCRLRNPGFNLGPNLGPSRFLRFVTLAAYGRLRPIGNPDPLRFGEKEGLLEEYATDNLLAADSLAVAIAPHSFLHLVQRDCAVLYAEGVPGKRERRQAEVAEKTAADDEVSWTVKFE